ncbi:transposase [Lipingzhangella halophila]|uniref:Transposase n=1 Tax=Lipingzhangella halophila TaxID=1783352 RepID=A0A7W7REZ7_9ACTN|nr:transposase family protein [Lipingzhangella halophila]MBB4930684.1 transposase [Lipingzhangella halophila]
MTNAAIQFEDLLFPDTIDITSFEADDVGNVLSIEAESLTTEASCPDCGASSRRIHGTYQRHPADLPAAGRAVRLRLRVRRFCCTHPTCSRRTFVEQVPGLTRRHGRWTERLRIALAATGLALAGRAAARLLTGHLAVPISRSTLLRQVLSLPEPQPPSPRVVGVDEFAFRKGQVYATALIEATTGKRVDVIEGRGAEAVADRLRRHPGVEVVCRDGSRVYAQAAAGGASRRGAGRRLVAPVARSGGRGRQGGRRAQCVLVGSYRAADGQAGPDHA